MGARAMIFVHFTAKLPPIIAGTTDTLFEMSFTRPVDDPIYMIRDIL